MIDEEEALCVKCGNLIPCPGWTNKRHYLHVCSVNIDPRTREERPVAVIHKGKMKPTYGAKTSCELFKPNLETIVERLLNG